MSKFEQSFGRAMAAASEVDAYEVAREALPGRMKSIVFLTFSAARKMASRYDDAVITHVKLRGGIISKRLERVDKDPPYLMPSEKIMGEKTIGTSAPPHTVTPRLIGEQARRFAERTGVCTICYAKQARTDSAICSSCARG